MKIMHENEAHVTNILGNFFRQHQDKILKKKETCHIKLLYRCCFDIISHEETLMILIFYLRKL